MGEQSYILHEEHIDQQTHTFNDITVHTFKEATAAIQAYLNNECVSFDIYNIVYAGGWATVWVSRADNGESIKLDTFICLSIPNEHQIWIPP